MKRKTIVVTFAILGTIIILIPFFFKLLILGFHTTSEVPKGDKLWGGYVADKEYVLRRDVFLMPGYGGMAKRRLALVPERSYGSPGRRNQSGPETIAVYEADPGKAVIRDIGGGWTSKLDVKGIVRKGTRLRMIRLEHHKGWSAFFGSVEELTPWAELLDGQFMGMEVDIDDISDSYRENKGEVFMHKPDDGLIALDMGQSDN